MGAPSDLAAKPGPGAGQVILTWMPGANAKAHVVQYKEKKPHSWWLSSSWPDLDGDADEATIDVGYAYCEDYEFQVKAVRDNISSAWSKPIQSKTGPFSRFFKPKDLEAEPGSNPGEVILSWTSGPDAGDHNVRYTRIKNGSTGAFNLSSERSLLKGVERGETKCGEPRYQATIALYGGETYRFRVQAIHKSGG